MTEEQIADLTIKILNDEAGWWPIIPKLMTDAEGDIWCLAQWKGENLWRVTHNFEGRYSKGHEKTYDNHSYPGFRDIDAAVQDGLDVINRDRIWRPAKLHYTMEEIREICLGQSQREE